MSLSLAYLTQVTLRPAYLGKKLAYSVGAAFLEDDPYGPFDPCRTWGAGREGSPGVRRFSARRRPTTTPGSRCRRRTPQLGVGHRIDMYHRGEPKWRPYVTQVVFSPDYLAEPLTPYPLPTKDGGVLRTHR